MFLLSGSIQPKLGGAILASGLSADELQERLEADPFVMAGIVSPETIEIAPARAEERLAFLVA